MSFWNREVLDEVSTSFESGGGASFELIPDNTTVKAAITEIKWTTAHERPDIELLNVRWDIVEPKAYAKRVVFQKLWVLGNNPQHKDPEAQGNTAQRMLAAIDANAGGRLSKLQERPTDVQLQSALSNKFMNIKLGVWDMNDKKGNWVKAISAAGKVDEPAPVQVQKPVQNNDWDSEIPF